MDPQIVSPHPPATPPGPHLVPITQPDAPEHHKKEEHKKEEHKRKKDKKHEKGKKGKHEDQDDESSKKKGKPRRVY